MRLFLMASLVVCGLALGHGQPAPAPLPLPFTALGHEPAWRLDIAAGGGMTLIAGYGATTITLPARPPEAVPGGRRYSGNADGRVLIITVLDRICEDVMTGMPRPYTVTVTLDEEALRGCGGDPATLLRGEPWIVEDIGTAGIVDRSRITLAFGADGELTGTASCSGYTAAYAVTGEGLAIETAASTQKACSPALMDQERTFLELLAAVTRFEIAEDGALILRAEGDRTIRARR